MSKLGGLWLSPNPPYTRWQITDFCGHAGYTEMFPSCTRWAACIGRMEKQ